MSEQYIFTIERLSKAYGKREVLKNIWLAFYPGAKIGVIGSNGAGKSSLLRIMALRRQGLSRHRPAHRRLHHRLSCRRSRASTEDKDVRGNIEEAVVATRALLNALRGDQQQARRAARRRRDGQAARTRWASCRKRSTPPTPGSSTASSKSPWTRCGCRPAMPRRPRSPAANGAASPCARCCCKSPTCCCSTSRPTISTPSRSPGSNGICRNITGTVVAVTHDRYFLDNVAQWILELDRGEGIPWKGNYSSWLEQKQARLEQGRAAGERPPQERWNANWNGPAWPRGPASPRARPAWPRMKSWPPRKSRSDAERAAHADPARPAPGRSRRPGRGRQEGLRRQPAHGGPELRPAARAASSASSAPTAPARPRSSA